MSDPPAASPGGARSLVVGLGNPLRHDDGVGPEVVRRLALRDDLPDDVDLAVDDRGGLSLMERMVGYERAIIVDAMASGGTVGRIRTIALGELPTVHSTCTHDTGLSTALALGRLAGAQLPDDEAIAIVGIEVADCYTFGEGCSAEVKAAIPHAVACVLELLRQSRLGDAPDPGDVAGPPGPWSL